MSNTNENFNSIEKTNDEFLAVVQSYDQSLDPKLSLGWRIPADAQNRYDTFIRQNPSDNVSFESFKYLRNHHIGQLFTAYSKAHNGTASQSYLRIDLPTTTDINAVRRVIGNRAGYIAYDGPMFLDSETIAAVCHLASVSKHGDFNPNSQTLTSDILSRVVDEMISTKNIFLENSKLEHPSVSMQTGSAIYNQTSIAERALENNVYGFYFDKIQHAETAQDFSKRKTNIFSKIASGFKTLFEKSQDPSRFGEKEMLGNQTHTPKSKTAEEIGDR